MQQNLNKFFIESELKLEIMAVILYMLAVFLNFMNCFDLSAFPRAVNRIMEIFKHIQISAFRYNKGKGNWFKLQGIRTKRM